MAIQAQYPSKALFISRGEQERKEMDFPTVSAAFLDQSPVLFSNGGNVNSRKRVREAMAGVPMALSSTPQRSSNPALPPSMMTVAHHSSPLVSTGLRLAFDDKRQSNPLLSTSNTHTTSTSAFSSFDDLAALINQQKQEIEQIVVAQGEQLRRTLAEKRQTHLRALLRAAQESTARRLRDKEAEIDRANGRRAELEELLTRLRTESMAWQMKAMADQSTASSLHAQLQAATAAALAQPKPKVGDESGESNRVDDAESAYVDPDRVEPARACRTCHERPATVVVLPCRHLCVCEACDSTAGLGWSGPVRLCPVCNAVRTGGVQVLMD